MLAEATLPTMRYDVPIQPRVVTSRSTSTRFASEMESAKEAVQSVPEVDEIEPVVKMEVGAPAELVPVPASVFDDDFFRATGVRGERAAEVDRVESGHADRMRDNHFPSVVRVQPEEARGAEAGDSSVRVPAFGSAAVTAADHAVPDELDIPAFLRRGN